MRFVDTTVLFYAVSRDEEEAEKRRTALELLEGEDLALSIQVLQELYVQATRATRPDPLSHEQALALSPLLSWATAKGGSLKRGVRRPPPIGSCHNPQPTTVGSSSSIL